MGAVTSTGRARNVSLEVTSRKEKKDSRSANSKGRTKRSSVNRPVLQLQVKPATLERVRQRLALTSGPHLITRNTLNSLARDSGIYDSPITSRNSSNASCNSDHAHFSRTYSTGSSDSVILLQIAEDEHAVIAKKVNGDSDNYDHLIPNIDFGHLCDCTYGHVSLLSDVEEEEGSMDETGDHVTNITFHNRHGVGGNHRGLNSFSRVQNPASIQVRTTDEQRSKHCRNFPSPPPSPAKDSLSSITTSSHRYLQQIRTGSIMKKSKSSSDLLHHQINTEEEESVIPRCMTVSQCEKDASDWTFGESIIRALSRKDLLIVDVENPQHQSEFEIIATWPRLKDEFKKQKSQSLSDLTDISDCI